MFPVRPTSAPTTAIGATPTAPPSIRMQSLQRARRLLSDLATPSSDRQSPDVPARPSLRPATSNITSESVTSSATPHSTHSVNVTASLPPYSLSSTHAPPQEIRHAPNVIKLSPYHQAEPASQWWSLFMAMVAYFNMSESAALSAFPFYLTDIPKQWYFQLNDTIKTSLETLKNSFLERFQKQKSSFDLNLLNLKQYKEEKVDDYMARVTRLTTEYDLPMHLLVGITIQGLKSELRQIVMPQSPDTLEKVRKLALVAEQTISSTETANASFAASIQQLEDRLMSSLSNKLEATAAAISNTNNSNFRNQSFQNRFSQNTQRNFRSNFLQHPNSNFNQNYSKNTFVKCQGCGGNCASRRNCRALGKLCLKCGKPDHFASVCRSSRRVNRTQ